MADIWNVWVHAECEYNDVVQNLMKELNQEFVLWYLEGIIKMT